MGLFGFGKKKNQEPINLKSLLSAAELELLVAEMQTVANRVPGETSSIISATAKTIAEGDSIPHTSGLDLCISALNMTNSFKEARPGNRELLSKLESIKKQS